MPDSAPIPNELITEDIIFLEEAGKSGISLEKQLQMRRIFQDINTMNDVKTLKSMLKNMVLLDNKKTQMFTDLTKNPIC